MPQRGGKALLTNALCDGSAIFCENSMKRTYGNSDGTGDQVGSEIAIYNIASDETQAAPINSVSTGSLV